MNFAPAAITAQSILKTTATKSGYDLSVLLSNVRREDITNVRHVAIYLCRKHVNRSYPIIAKVFGKHHTTLIHGYNKIEYILSNPENSWHYYVKRLIGLVEAELGTTNLKPVVHVKRTGPVGLGAEKLKVLKPNRRIPWHGGYWDQDPTLMVEVWIRASTTKGNRIPRIRRKAGNLRWKWLDADSDIIEYRLDMKSERKKQNRSKKKEVV